MHLKVELSTVLTTVTIAGVQQPVIGQQVDEADIRMKDGEVSVLGGLSDKQNNDSLSGLPGFTNVPLLSYIFGTKTRDTRDNEILIAMVPHVVRAADLSAMGETGVLAGTERVVKVQRRGDNAPAGAPGGPGQASNAVPLSPAPATPASSTTPNPVPLVGQPNAQPGPGTNPAPAPPQVRPPGPAAGQQPPAQQPQASSRPPGANP